MSPTKAIFFDERERRWRKTRRFLVLAAVFAFAVLAVFFTAMFDGPDLPRDGEPAKPSIDLNWFGRSSAPSKLVPWGADVGVASANGAPVRMAFYVPDDPGSLRALREHHQDIDIVVPARLHATGGDGAMTVAEDHDFDDWLAENRGVPGGVPEVMPMIDNFDGTAWRGDDVGRTLGRTESRRSLAAALDRYAAEKRAAGVVVDFEEISQSAQPALRDFAADLAARLHAHGRRLVMTAPAADSDYAYDTLGRLSDAVVLMNYDEHWERSAPGPIASQAWYAANVADALKLIPARKLLVGIANYAYDWTAGAQPDADAAQSITISEALDLAQSSAAVLALDPQSLNPYFSYPDAAHQTHHVWLLDAVTASNQIDVAERSATLGTALWRLGSEDPTFWALWSHSGRGDKTTRALQTVPAAPSPEVVGDGDVWRITRPPQAGRRQIRRDPKTGTIVEERFSRYPRPYRVEQRGNAPGKIALTFDDGPDARWTPAILDVLRDKQVKATFFVIGLEAYQEPALLERIYAEGHEIGNHTYTHPDLEELSPAQMRLELVLSQRLIQSRVGASTRLFRPPYGVDDQAVSNVGLDRLRLAQQLGYEIVGAQIDANDWGSEGNEKPPTPDEIVSTVLEQAHDGDGHVVLLHDGGGDRSSTIAALPRLIDALRADGFELAAVSELLGETRDDAMPPLAASGRWMARANLVVFDSFRGLRLAIAAICFTAISMLAARTIFVVAIAFRHKRRPKPAPLAESPLVSVLIPAYDEEKVISETILSVLASDYRNLEVIVVDDGSRDETSAIVEQQFGADPRVRLFRQANQGKSGALNHAVAESRGEILVTIDADTRIDPPAIDRLVRHFASPDIAGVAGNTKVLNRCRFLTRWQALEYISGQNLEKRAFDLLNCITVVPGALGAWRAEAIRSNGGFSMHTVAEDTDLTLTIRKNGRRIVFDDEAIAWTIAPETPAALVRQRFRWTFGTLQALWKHRDAFGRERYGTLGRVALPHILLFQILLPIFCPVVDLLFFGSILLWALAHLHVGPFLQFWTPGDVALAITFFAAFLLIDVGTSVAAFVLEEREDWRLLASLPLQRFFYRQLMDIVLFQALLRAVQGRAVGWGRVGPRSFSPFPEPARAARVATDAA
jgi:cellulose synthase/poly-beta-1,6-N-acetylglucosamine synthase-like glycosyltransferase/peptidoglycan/xylan/chitin deacetylase (PgdA/CDA1 family)/spore germination protein YaaH